MTDKIALNQSLAACGAILVVFTGICHEVIGTQLFPWGPAVFGGPLPWHLVGIGCFLAGVGLLLGVLGVIRFPVVLVSLIIVPIALGVFAFTAITHGTFHLFALTLAIAAAVMAVCYRRAIALRG